MIPLSEPHIAGNEWKYIKECLDTGWVSSVGSFVDRFEHDMATYLGAPHAVATVNGTAALHVALLVAGVKPDEEVLVSTLTFIAPVNTIRYVGAYPVFIDAEPKHWQMDAHKVVSFLEEGCELRHGGLYNRNTGRKVTAILPVHILGHPVDMDPILDVARKYNLVVIEDATEGLGALYKGKKVGTLGDISCLSFNGNKIMTTGGGGMIVTPRADWAKKARYLTTQAKDDPVEFVHDEIGYNYRLTNIQAAMGCAQLEKLDTSLQVKKQIAKKYVTSLEEVQGISPLKEASWATSAFWMAPFLIDEKKYGMNRWELIQRLAQEGIQTRPLWRPVHQNEPYRFLSACCENADQLYQKAIHLPCSVGLQEKDQEFVIHTLRKFQGS